MSKEYVSRFKPEEVDLYMEVIGLEDYIFPKNVVREGELGRRLEELFIVTNQYLTNVFNDEELLFYLDLTGIPGAEIIWFEREEILKDMYAVIGNERQRDDINDIFILRDGFFDDIVPDSMRNTIHGSRRRGGAVHTLSATGLQMAAFIRPLQIGFREGPSVSWIYSSRYGSSSTQRRARPSSRCR